MTVTHGYLRCRHHPIQGGLRRYADIESSSVRYISLGVEANERADALAKYAHRRGYEWIFAQSPVEFLARPGSPLRPADPVAAFDAAHVLDETVGLHGNDELLEILEEASA